MSDNTAIATEARAPAAKPAPGFGNLTPKTLDEALRFADILAKSSIVPKDYQGNPGNVLVAVQWGAEIGLPPLQAMQNIAVINGRPAIWGDAMLALVRGSGLLVRIEEEISEDGQEATCTVQRRGEEPVTRTFTMEDAKRAGLAGKQGPWKQYPRRMLQMRARSWALRDVFPDVLRGVHIAEEAMDMPPIEAEAVPAEEASPKRLSRAERARAALAKRRKPQQDQPAPPALQDVLDAISSADSDQALEAAADLAARLQDEGDIKAARKAWRERKKALAAGAGPSYAQIADQINQAQTSEAAMAAIEHIGHLPPEQREELTQLASRRVDAIEAASGGEQDALI